MDADVVIDLLRGLPAALTWFSTLQTLPFLSGIAALEIAFGAANKAELRKIEVFLSGFVIVWPDAIDIEQTLSLAKFRLSQGTGLSDAITAAVATRRQEALLTFNVKHYVGIPGVMTIQPYVR